MKYVFFWTKYVLIELLYGIAFFVGIFGGFPICYFLKYGLNVDKKWWFLNSTIDGDFGATWWRKREGITEYNFWVAFRWWFRNPTWSFRKLLVPKWNPPNEIEIIKSTVPNLDYNIDWANRDEGKYGTVHVYYKMNGKWYGRYSRASPDYELQFGHGGDMWRFRLKNIPAIIKSFF